MLGAPSVATDTRWFVFMAFVLKHSKTASQMSYPRVWPFRGINSINSSCGPAEFAYRQNNVIYIKNNNFLKFMLSLLLLIQFIGKDNYAKQRQNSQKKRRKKRKKNNNNANHMTKLEEL